MAKALHASKPKFYYHNAKAPENFHGRFIYIHPIFFLDKKIKMCYTVFDADIFKHDLIGEDNMKKLFACILTAIIILTTFISCDMGFEDITTPTLNVPSNTENTDKPSDDNTDKDNNQSNTQKPELKGLQYELNEDKKSYSLVGYGTMSDTDIVIDTYEGLPVTAIKERALDGCKSIKSVTLGKSITDIGVSAFYNCTSLEKVHTSDLSTWMSIDFHDRQANPLYYAHDLYINGECLTELTLPEGLVGIGKYTFSGCESIESVTFPEDIAYIKTDAFYGCKNLRRVNISSLTSWCNIDFATYDSNPLYYAYDLYLSDDLITELTIPDDVKQISAFAFYNCKKMTKVTFPEGLEKIGKNAFSACAGLTEISIPDSVTEIGSEAFIYCGSLKRVDLGNGIEDIKGSAFKSCSSLAEVHIASLNDWLEIKFGNAEANPINSTKKLHIGDALLTELTVPDSFTKINDYAFIGCTNLTKLTIPDSVTTIGKSAFSGCVTLSTVSIGNGIANIDADAFANCPKISYTLADNIYYLGNTSNPHAVLMFPKSKSQREYVINANTRVIYCNAFKKCTQLSSVTIPDSVLAIGDYAFDNCTALMKITFGKNLESIGYAAFNSCSFLMGVTIPDSVTYIGGYAFYSCDTLVKVSIGNGLKSIEECTFYMCKKLATLELGSGLKKIGSAAFYYCSNLLSLTIPDSVTEIDSRAFENCWSIPEVKLGKGVTTIKTRAFYNCKAIKSVTGGDSLTNIETRAFGECHALNSVSLGTGVTYIPNDTFYNCSALTTLIYSGTTEQWNSVHKENGWKSSTACNVTCNDGSIVEK